MKRKDFEMLSAIKIKERIINKDRTLLYGYTCNKKNFHVYMKNMKIVPDKWLYPEYCDYRFCKLLKNHGIELPFTAYQEERPIKDFYGFTIE